MYSDSKFRQTTSVISGTRVYSNRVVLGKGILTQSHELVINIAQIAFASAGEQDLGVADDRPHSFRSLSTREKFA